MLNKILRLARQTAPLLGHRWTAQPHHWMGRTGAALVHADGRRLHLLPVDGRPAHVEVTVRYPDAPVTVWDHERPSTQFRTDRPPAALADAITAKLLPVYNELYPKMVAAAASARQTDEEQQALAQRLAALVPGAELTRTAPSPWIEYRPRQGSIGSMKAQVLSWGQHIVEFRYVDDATLQALMTAYGEAVRRRQNRSATAP
ncbi:hypothetical protein GCM10010329_82650 [Streptomyces spiroverticillatus]|uniref:Uncharacterized protein n=1 Tax=Streptomyces finlayi TaxID=67296 RepID=A0A918X9W3_9ACTN|nr:hypothetical protein [Streptomyces finlayi]GHA47717.1 hypothetical protein GCM10010329_82650 [Streptomyces spiroverticillatus]GHD18683.1 hypothetical protein GCM10010334_81720 [Streptomyces finlayi]